VPRLRLTRASPAGDGGRAGRRPPAARGLTAAVATGLLLVLAFPAADLGAVAFVALVPLLVAAGRRRPPAAAGLGVLAGLVFFGIHVSWIAAIGDDRAAGVAAWLALSALQAAFLGAFAALVPIARPLGAWRVPLLAVVWAGIELARAHVPLGGFAWGQLGLTQHDGGPLLPLARVLGVYGLSLVVVACNLALAEALGAVVAGRRRRAAAWVALALALPFAGLAAPAPPAAAGPPRRLAVIQGNVPFDRDNRGLTTRAVFDAHVRMTEQLAGTPPADLVVWAEGSMDDDPLVDAARSQAVLRALRAADAPLLAGATTELGGDRYATEALLFTPDGRLADRYVKRRLVPFGEYVPFGSLMRRLVPATGQLPYDKVPGRGLRPLDVDGSRVGVLLCYETAYPDDARRLARQGAGFLVMLTNNASFGRGPLGRQHLATSQLRAVEEGRPVVHAAISGISAVVGPDGRASGTTGLYEAATIRAGVVPRSGLTPYGRAGRLVEAALVGTATAALAARLAARLRLRRPASAGPPAGPPAGGRARPGRDTVASQPPAPDPDPQVNPPARRAEAPDTPRR
jgi:apolipoprotein N-acyltransferase